jgi:hypothetical protein
MMSMYSKNKERPLESGSDCCSTATIVHLLP